MKADGDRQKPTLPTELKASCRSQLAGEFLEILRQQAGFYGM